MQRITGQCDLMVTRPTDDTVGIALLDLVLADYHGTAEKDHAENAHIISMDESKALASRLKSVKTANSKVSIDLAGVSLTINGHRALERQRNPNSAVMVFNQLPSFEANLSGDDAEGLAELLLLATKKGWRERSARICVSFRFSYERNPESLLREDAETAFYSIALPPEFPQQQQQP